VQKTGTTPQEPPENTGNESKTDEPHSPQSSVKTRVKSSEKTRTKTRTILLTLLNQNPTISRQELATTLGITLKGVDWQTQELKNKGIVRRVGSNRVGSWEVLK
jgi:ATP-dependent DNA helicase RecG